MLFAVFTLITFVLFALSLYKLKDKKFLSKSFLALLIFSLIANIALATAFAAPFGDGIGINNDLAYWIITDNKTWTLNLFRSFYQNSTILSSTILLCYCLSLLWEAKEAENKG